MPLLDDQFDYASATHFELESGRVFPHVRMPEVVDFLKSRNVESVTDNAGSFRIVADGTKLVLEHVNGSLHQWSIRHAFFQKLLRWYHVPRRPLYRMELDAILPFLNGILRLIKNDVCVRIEDGEALTITSPKYAHVRDLDILARSAEPIEYITRTDFFTRAFTILPVKAEAVPGDLCGFGANILNSETGFMALEVTTYIYRYVCSNGAVTGIPRTKPGGLIHYGISPESCEQYLSAAFSDLNEAIPVLVARLKAAAKRPLPDTKTVIARLNQILDFPRGKALYASFELQGRSTLYDLFNFLTNRAKAHQPEKQLQIEAYAGDLLLSAP